MGCDIHIVVERRKIGRTKWTGIYSSDAAYPIIRKNMIAARRNYEFFTELANVRGHSETSKSARNLPEDMSELSREQFWRAPTDYHSASHMTPSEFCEAWSRANDKYDERFQSKEVRKDFVVYDLIGIDADEGDEFRVVFWFDN